MHLLHRAAAVNLDDVDGTAATQSREDKVLLVSVSDPGQRMQQQIAAQMASFQLVRPFVSLWLFDKFLT